MPQVKQYPNRKSAASPTYVGCGRVNSQPLRAVHPKLHPAAVFQGCRVNSFPKADGPHPPNYHGVQGFRRSVSRRLSNRRFKHIPICQILVELIRHFDVRVSWVRVRDRRCRAELGYAAASCEMLHRCRHHLLHTSHAPKDPADLQYLTYTWCAAPNSVKQLVSSTTRCVPLVETERACGE